MTWKIEKLLGAKKTVVGLSNEVANYAVQTRSN
jgi:hypothetical protein